MKLKSLVQQKVIAYMTNRILQLIQMPTYQEDASKLITQTFFCYEIAMKAAYNDPENMEVLAAAVDARANFIDAMREWAAIPLLADDKLPPRIATYEYQDVTVENAETGEETVNRVLVKITSAEMPELNTTEGLFTATKMSKIKATIQKLKEDMINETT